MSAGGKVITLNSAPSKTDMKTNLLFLLVTLKIPF